MNTLRHKGSILVMVMMVGIMFVSVGGVVNLQYHQGGIAA